MDSEVLKKHGRIGMDIPFVVTVPDNVEEDMEFSFKLIQNEFNGSYTSYKTLNSHQGEITISNVRGNGVKSSSPIEVGTYGGKYLLFVSFVVYNENSNWNIEVVFTKKEKKA